jgi:O-antigen ligase
MHTIFGDLNMSSIVPTKSTHPYLLATVVILCSMSLAALAFLGYRLVSQHRYMQRGVLHESLPPLSLPSDGLFGVNASLEQYSSDEELRQALSLVRAGGFHWLRQHFPWAEIEPLPGEYDWTRWDRLIAEVKGQGLELIAVLDTSPVWARSPADRDNRFAPPQFVTTYGLFVRAFAQRYGEQITCYEVWDQPNLSPHWGVRPIDPASYVRLLKVAAAELKRADSDAIVLSAGLAPTTEAGGRNMSDVLFLRGIYQAGGRGHFDVLAAKPYGFWSGPEDRRVDPQVLNFSRVVMLREEMVRHGDGDVPIWAVEFGWNSLPQDWQGRPSPWGTDDIAKQTDRTARAVRRARQEWAWLGELCWSQLQPAVPVEDPLWGFALLGPDFEPTSFYSTLQDAISTPVAKVAVDHTSYYLKLTLLFLAALLTLALLARLWPLSPWQAWARRMATAYLATPEWAQWMWMGLSLAMYYFLPWPMPSLLALAFSGTLICLRLDIGLTYCVFSIPFFLYPKVIFGKSFSTVETLILLCFATWLGLWLRREVLSSGVRSSVRNFSRWVSVWLRSLRSLDWAVVAFVLLSALSLLVSINLGVSIRELRVIIIEPVLLYFLLRQAGFSQKQLMRLMDALLLAGLVVSVLGLYQYFVSGDVIVAEGVRRIRGVYASPNNLSLLLGRIIPLGISVLLIGRTPRRRVYGLVLVPLVLCLFLTYSRGGWLLSLPAALLTIGLFRGRRATLLAVAAIVTCALVLLPVVGTERFLSLLDFEQGTTFRRLKLWEASLAMIRDHPITGVGLDNFLYQYPDYVLPEAWQEPDLSHPHNIVLDYWTRLGIGGVVVLLWLQVAFFTRALRLYQRLPDGDQRAIILGLIASMASMLAHGLIDNSYFLVDLAFIFFLSFGWMRAMDAVVRPEAVVSGDESM